MARTPFVLADRARLQQFALLGRARRLFQAANQIRWTDEDGVPWVGVRLDGHGFAVCRLGQGWVFDPFLRATVPGRLEERRRQVRHAAGAAQALAEAVGALRLGGRCERVLWSVHRHVLESGCSVVRVPDVALARDVYGHAEADWPAHWRTDLLAVLKGLACLHVADWPGERRPAFGANTALVHLAAELRGEDDGCDDACPLRRGPRHHHFQVNVGRGFLGTLEQLADADDGSGVRRYDFSRASPEEGVTLRQLGKGGQVVRVFLPAKLGAPAACSELTGGQHDLLQAAVRELTRARRRRGRGQAPAEAEVIEGGTIHAVSGNRRLRCPLLDVKCRYEGFNGNKARRGQGYLLTTWMARAGYAADDIRRFIEDLAGLADRLRLTVVGLDPAGERPWAGLDRLRALAATAAGRDALGRLHLRLYAEPAWEDRWTDLFNGAAPAAPTGVEVRTNAAALVDRLARLGVSRRQLAADLGVDPSLLTKRLNGKKNWPRAFAERTSVYLAKAESTGKAGDRPASPLHAAEGYLARGWSIVPILPGEKKPCVRWKPCQKRSPTQEEVAGWFRRWPDAGLAVVLGPLSGVVVIDVDGPQAHEALLHRLGAVPVAPKALSGSRSPNRYHLYFKHPDVPTRAKYTPWHPKLEFRGAGGLVVMPPSLHKSGNRYAWAPGCSPEEMTLPELPPAVLEALTVRAAVPAEEVKDGVPRCGEMVAVSGVVMAGLSVGAVSPSTLQFLEGRWAEGPGWNEHLFSAACDLHGRGVPLEEARPALLAGARPWDETQLKKAEDTIASAYAQVRLPSRY